MAEPTADDLDLSREAQTKFRKALLEVYNVINKKMVPIDHRAVTDLVPPKPLTREKAETLVPSEGLAGVPEGRELVVVRTVWRDAVISDLVSKAASTAEAVWTLAGAGWGADAFALCRHLLENIIVVEWLLPKDEDLRKKRIDTFILHFETFLVHLKEVERLLGDEDGGGEEDDEARQRRADISAQVFEDKWVHWAWMETKKGKKDLVKLREMAEEVGFGSMYVRDYFEMSVFVHSAPASVRTTSRSPVFAIRAEPFRSPNRARRAEGLANILIWNLLGLVNDRYSLGVSGELSAMRAILEPRVQGTER